ncbi:outer membrane protein assembly factor BamB family protein [Cellulomonas palmilytica]|uniref:outer membrane protein assembly factor BamB family protein n=1 Tax=Cellulomonas palmilytica TaxID=2608402 RepID=UPI001F436930|nr:PQQ-binding-like beta-propeller repeat protein [Cellulomonas palmilytica]UJP39395.1 PQQ-binding-like beta-propeller repeat protein [Cellulomonas palmilytica]
MASGRRAAQLQLVEVDEETAPAVPVGDPARVDPGAQRDEADPEEEPARAADDAGPVRPGILRRHAVLWGVAGLVVVALVAVLAGVDAARRDRAYEQAVTVPGLLTPVDGPVHVRWRAPAKPGDGTVLVADDTVVVVTQDSAGRHVTGYEAGTGAQRWTARVTPAQAGAQDVPVQCPSWRDGRVNSLVVCMTGLIEPVYVAGEQVTAGLRIVAFDAATGQDRGSWTRVGTLTGFGRVGDDVVVAVTEPDGRTAVERRDARTGEVRWSYVSRERFSSALAIERSAMELTDQVAVVRGAQIAVLRLDDGTLLRDDARGKALALTPFREGYAAWTPAGAGRLYDRDGGEGPPLPAVPSRLDVDDDSALDVIVVSTGLAVRGLEAETGDELWSLGLRATPRAVVDETLLTSDGGRYAAYDVRTGTPLWSDPSDAPDWPPLTDGSLVLTASRDDGVTTLMARGLRDGAQRWQVELPRQVTQLAAVGGLLVGRTADGIVLLGP